MCMGVIGKTKPHNFTIYLCIVFSVCPERISNYRNEWSILLKNDLKFKYGKPAWYATIWCHSGDDLNLQLWKFFSLSVFHSVTWAWAAFSLILFRDPERTEITQKDDVKRIQSSWKLLLVVPFFCHSARKQVWALCRRPTLPTWTRSQGRRRKKRKKKRNPINLIKSNGAEAEGTNISVHIFMRFSLSKPFCTGFLITFVHSSISMELCIRVGTYVFLIGKLNTIKTSHSAVCTVLVNAELPTQTGTELCNRVSISVEFRNMQVWDTVSFDQRYKLFACIEIKNSFCRGYI